MIFLVFLSACVTEGEDTAEAWCAEQPEVTWDSFSHGFMLDYCTSCHSVNNTGSRYGAPEGVNFDAESDVAAQVERVWTRVVADEDMPEAGGVYRDDLYLFDIYLTCTLDRTP